MKYLALLVFLAACSSVISEDTAIEAAEDFMKERVKFFAVNESSSVDIEQYTYDVQDISFANGEYSIVFHVTGTLGNESKEGDLMVVVDSGGRVLNIGKRQ